ncbi:hypothetical protein JCM8547_002376 [Rhodosporidiobolus lusitaniae]
MLWSMGGRKRSVAGDETPAPPPLDLDPEEEERLADEWGLSKALSNVESDFVAGSSPTSPTFGSMAGVGLARFPTATAMSDAGLLNQERKLEALAETAAEEDIELLETRSMPDLDRPRTVSFAEAVLGGLDQRLKERAAVRTLVGVSEDDKENDGETLSAGPRIKIIERTAEQRRRTQSLGPGALGLASLPTFGDLTAVTEASSSTSGGNGIASRDSLFLGPRARTSSSIAARPFSSFSAAPSRTVSSSRRGSLDGPASRLSIAIPSGAASGPCSPASPLSPASPSSNIPPRPSTSMSLTTSLEPSTLFTSRFDPVFIAQQRAELIKERPQFSNPDAGKPPKVVLMPAPLAGRPPSPVRKPRVEGPSEEGEEEEEELVEEEEEEEPQRPAGALYGRSLMDVIAERKAVQRAQNKAYVPGSDGRRSMFEWKETSPAAQFALAKLEGHVEEDEDEEKDDDVPLALVPAGGAHLSKKADAARRMPASKSHVSIFGPDLIYQRELARAKELEEEERVERERIEAIQEAKREKARLKEENRRSRGVLKKADKRRSQGFPALATSQEWEEREMEEVEEARPYHSPARNTFAQPPHLPSPTRPRTAHTLAPSLSIPAGLNGGLTTSASGGDWFRPPSPPVKLTNDSEDEEEDDFFKPWPASALALNGRTTPGATINGRVSRHFGSDESSDEEEEEEDTKVLATHRPTASRASLPLPGELSLDHAVDLNSAAPVSPDAGPSRHLPLPGEASSVGHGIEEASVVDTEEDRPLGIRYSRQSLMLQNPVPNEEDDEEPLGKRYSRQSLLLPLDLPAVETTSSELDINFDGDVQEQQEKPAVEDDEDEDDKPLGARFSTILPVSQDNDDVPLAIHRLSLAPTSITQNRFQPSATLHAIDDDGKTVASEDSDDRPLGLKAAPPIQQQQQQPGGFGFFPPPVQPAFTPGYGLPPQLSCHTLGFFPPPALPALGMPFVPPAPMLQDPMSLALAQMQMHQQQQAAATGVGGQGAGPAAGIERWRREVV